ncbi:APC family permease [Desulfosporosinus sp. PR]|uniref:APC family permease n=1 Tax=Candidatus Desulfosporosinus nitrosoreducens TaxID=3401928 RepID=UPI0027F964DE|nr:APC family permease [Desulfosporosinus sp. PR]MDQ7092512.1 APC family permease [Desulfosporosinus sp. PR]
MSSASSKLIWLRLRTLIFGHPLSTQSADNQKLGIFGGIPVFGSDVISSQGYAPDAILYVLILAGAAGYGAAMKVTTAIVLLLVSVLLLYRRTIQKYSQGGGSYTVARAYLGEKMGLLAGASLSIDYILTVAVSVSSAVENLTGIFSWLGPSPHRVLADCLIILFMTVVNLRGLKESARLFAIPVYTYIFSIFALVGFGLFKYFLYGITPLPDSQAIIAANTQGLTLFVFLRAMAAGTTALTGTEAVSNGVSAFRAPAQKKAINTLLILGFIVALGLAGLVFLASKLQLIPSNDNTIINQLGLLIFGKTIIYYILMASIAIILVIAANTPFVGLPILLSLMARDGYAPRYFKNLGDRLVYSAGIWTLSMIGLILIVIFQGDTHSMLPLYAIGVFISFSLTGFGLAKYCIETKPKNYHRDLVIFSFGGGISFLVFMIFLITKFTEGAWIVAIIIPLLMFFFNSVSKVYKQEIILIKPTLEEIQNFNKEITRIFNRRSNVDLAEYNSKIVVPVFDLNRIVLEALLYGYELTPLITAVHIASDKERAEKLQRHWQQSNIQIELVIVESPYRATVQDLLQYLEMVEKDPRYSKVTLVVPEFVPPKLWQNFLHNQTGQLMKLLLLLRKNILVTSLPYHPPEK